MSFALLQPMVQEKLFLTCVKVIRLAEEWAQGGGHLQGYEDENDRPSHQMMASFHSEEMGHPEDQGQSEVETNQPECQNKESHEWD